MGCSPSIFSKLFIICQLLGTITVKSSKLFQKANASIFYAALSLPTTKLYFVFQRHRAGHSRCNQHAGGHVSEPNAHRYTLSQKRHVKSQPSEQVPEGRQAGRSAAGPAQPHDEGHQDAHPRGGSPSMIVVATESRWPRNAHASVLGRHISITASAG
jgi:hypothetical protein